MTKKVVKAFFDCQWAWTPPPNENSWIRACFDQAYQILSNQMFLMLAYMGQHAHLRSQFRGAFVFSCLESIIDMQAASKNLRS